MTQDTQEQGADQALLSIQAEASAMEDKYRPVDPNAPTEPEASDVAMLEKANVEIVEFVWDAAGGFLPEDVASRYGKTSANASPRVGRLWPSSEGGTSACGWPNGALRSRLARR